jgi:hypothetical protein
LLRAAYLWHKRRNCERERHGRHQTDTLDHRRGHRGL